MTMADVVLHKTPIGLDASIWAFFAPLMTGARLLLGEPGVHRDAKQLARVLAQEGVTVLQVVPTLLRHLVEEDTFASCRSLRLLFSGGEALSAELASRVMAATRARLVNLYGPTEVTVDATFFPVDAAFSS